MPYKLTLDGLEIACDKLADMREVAAGCGDSRFWSLRDQNAYSPFEWGGF